MKSNIDKSNSKKYLCLLLKIIILIIPITWGLYVVWKYGVNVCFGDEWTFMFDRENLFSWNYLWKQHNEHRMFFPKIVMIIVGNLFSWNSKYFMYTSQLFLLVLYYVVIRIILDGKHIKDISWSDTIESLLLGFSIYNAAQYENMLWGFQIAWFMIVSLGALSYYYFDKYLKMDSYRYLILSMFLAIIVSFSLLHGLTVWGGYIGIVIISLLIRKRLKLETYATICATCSISIFLYFYGWSGISSHAQYISYDTNQVLSYFLGQVGASLLPNQNILSYLAGFLITVICCLIGINIIIEKKINENIIYIGPIVMGLGSMFVISLGRSNSDIQSRYITNSMLFISFFMLLCIKELRLTLTHENKDSFFHDSKVRGYISMMTQALPPVEGFLFVCMCTLVICRNPGVRGDLKDCYQARMWAKVVLANYEDMEIEDYNYFYRLFGNMDSEKLHDALTDIDRMKSERINVFSEDNSDIYFSETILPDRINEKAIDTYVFNTGRFSLYDKTIRIEISDFGGIEKKELKKSDFYVSINGIAYNAAWYGRTMSFIKNKSVLNEGSNVCQVFLASKDTLYVSKEISLYKNGDEIIILDPDQKDNSDM